MIHRNRAFIVTTLLVLGGLAWAASRQDRAPAPAKGAESEPLWTVEGYPELAVLAAKAKQEKRRLLIGLSGGDT